MYDTIRQSDARIPITLCECYLDACRYEYGKSYTNLITYSERFGSSSDWTANDAAVTTNIAIAPNGELAADEIEDTGSAAFGNIENTAISYNPYYFYCASIYIKKDNIPKETRYCGLRIRFDGSVTDARTIYFDTSTGEYSETGTATEGFFDVEDAGDYWRVWISARTTDFSNTACDIALYAAVGQYGGGSWNNDNTLTGSVTVWGAQIVLGYYPGHYIETVASSITAGCGATDAKANLLTYSEQFDNAAWSKSNLSVTANSALSPDGGIYGDKLTDNNGAAEGYCSQVVTSGITANDGIYRTFSVYLKDGTAANPIIWLAYFNGSSYYAHTAILDLSFGTITSSSGSGTASIEYVEDGWYRVIVTLQNNLASSYNIQCRIQSENWGLGGAETGDFYAWGAQLVEGDQAGIYYKTEATAFSGTVGEECYNTWQTCQDTANFRKILKRYRFYEAISDWPIGQNGYPVLDGNPKFAPCQIDPRGSLGKRGTVTISLSDFSDDDVYTDPYYATRTYNPIEQGTFFGKLKARMPYYKGRKMSVFHGYIDPDSFSWLDFESHEYVIDSLNLDIDGKATMRGKDLLKLVDDNTAVAPATSTGTLSAAYTAGVSTTLVLQTGEGVDYDTDPYTGSAISVSVPGYVRIGDNVLKYTGVSTDTLTGVVGGQNGSTDTDLAIYDSVQQCLNFDNKNVVDIIHFLLLNYTDLREIHLPYDAGMTTPTGTDDEWDVEKTSWLSGNDLTHLVTESTGIAKLLKQICEQNLIYMWWHAKDKEVKLRAIAPAIKNEVPPTLTDDANIIDNSISVSDNVEGRISEVWVYYNQIDITGDLDKAENYSVVKVQVDTASEGGNAYSEKAIRVIYANWLTGANAGLIITLAGRLLSRYAGTPNKAKFKIDMKDMNFFTGNSVIIDSIAFQDIDGSNLLQKMQILKATEDHDKQLVTLEGETWDYGIFLYAFVAPDTMGDYTSESAANQTNYGFICQNDGLYTNGDNGHLIA